MVWLLGGEFLKKYIVEITSIMYMYVNYLRYNADEHVGFLRATALAQQLCTAHCNSYDLAQCSYVSVCHMLHQD